MAELERLRAIYWRAMAELNQAPEAELARLGAVGIVVPLLREAGLLERPEKISPDLGRCPDGSPRRGAMETGSPKERVSPETPDA